MKNCKPLFCFMCCLLTTQLSYSQLINQILRGKEILAESLISESTLSIQCKDRDYTNVLLGCLNYFEQQGFNISYYFHLNENPTLAKKDLEKANNHSNTSEIKYWINITHVFKSTGNYYTWVMKISKIENYTLAQFPKEYFLMESSTIEGLFRKLNKKIKKLKE